MRNTLKPLIASVCAMLAWQPAAGQVNAWPQFLVVPAQPAAADSNRTVYGSDQNLYIHTFKSRDSVSIQSNTALYGVNQSVDYELKNDSWFDTKDQFTIFRGAWFGRNCRWTFCRSGMDAGAYP